jgi:DNA polymerase III delta prime subunit
LKESLPVGGGASDEFLYSKTQYITKIVIHNFRIVEDMTLEFAQPQVAPEPTQQQNIAPDFSEPQKKPWMIILGENGVGKSSILKAVALALMGKEKQKALKLRPEKFLTHGRDEGFIEVHLTGYTKPFRLDFKRGDKEFQTNGNKLHTLFFCYGGTRLLPSGRRRRPGSTDDYARINNLFDPFLPLIKAESWLLGLNDEKFGFSAKAVKKLLMSDEANTLVREPPDKPREVFLEFETRKSRDTLERLSDGYQSVIALAADILEIMLKHYDEVEDSEGIVLIDEIDVHLHPRWKVEIINLLRTVFPRVQFLVTTHDPLCLLGTLPGEVHVLYRPPDSNQVSVKQVDVPPGTTADQVLTGFWFGLRSTLDDDTLALLDKHRRLLREKVPETNEERHSLEVELRKRLGTFADTSVDRMAQSVAAEVIQGDVSKLGAEDRDAMRQNIRQKLLQMIKEKKEKGG